MVYFTIAIPNKGNLAKPSQQLARDLGFETSNSRQYNYLSTNGKYQFLLARAKNIPEYVATGAADLGITGQDLVLEQEADVAELLALPFGRCRLVYAVPKNSAGESKRIATAFPNLTRKFIAGRNLNVEVVELSGAIEASVASGVADAIVDLTSTGKTLAANNLEERETLLYSSAVLVANKLSLKEKENEIKEVLKVLKNDFPILYSELSKLSRDERRKLLRRKPQNNEEILRTVRDVFEAIQKEKDDALCSFVERFQGAKLKAKQLEVTREEIKQAYAAVDEKVIIALRQSAGNIARFAKKELPQQWEIKTEGGFMGKKIVPLDSVGVYAPGGTAAYPSSVLMGVIPAKIAEVKEIVLCTPCNDQGNCNPVVLVAADLAGATRIFRIGGSQAIAAMAIGTRTVPRTAKIVGPGNAFVAAAKLEALSRNLVAIDSPAGPTEVFIIADETANPKFIAADLLAQAEHDVNSAAVLVSTSQKIIKEVETQLKEQLTLLPRKSIVRESLSRNGALLLAQDVEEAIVFCNEYAPEHLELMVERPFVWLNKVRNAGAVFCGNYTCEAAGDYAAGPNHVLPTAGNARSYSGLSARDYVREMNYLRLEKRGLEKLRDSIVTLANAEGLEGHALSVLKRFEDGEDVK